LNEGTRSWQAEGIREAGKARGVNHREDTTVK